MAFRARLEPGIENENKNQNFNFMEIKTTFGYRKILGDQEKQILTHVWFHR